MSLAMYKHSLMTSKIERQKNRKTINKRKRKIKKFNK